jgi:predicted metallopeptidase
MNGSNWSMIEGMSEILIEISLTPSFIYSVVRNKFNNLPVWTKVFVFCGRCVFITVPISTFHRTMHLVFVYLYLLFNNTFSTLNSSQ